MVRSLVTRTNPFGGDMPREIDTRGRNYMKLQATILWKKSLMFLSWALEHLAALVRVAKFWAVSVAASLVAGPWAENDSDSKRQLDFHNFHNLTHNFHLFSDKRDKLQLVEPRKASTQKPWHETSQNTCLVKALVHQIAGNHRYIGIISHTKRFVLFRYSSSVPNVLAIHPMVEKGPLPWTLEMR